jgi:hypothetical protein
VVQCYSMYMLMCMLTGICVLLLLPHLEHNCMQLVVLGGAASDCAGCCLTWNTSALMSATASSGLSPVSRPLNSSSVDSSSSCRERQRSSRHQGCVPYREQVVQYSTVCL